MHVYKGTIIEFQGSWMSGLATLMVEDAKTGEVREVPVDSGALGRALGAAFDAIGAGHTIDNDKIRGEEIYYIMDDIGLTMASFVRVEDAPEELHEFYDN